MSTIITRKLDGRRSVKIIYLGKIKALLVVPSPNGRTIRNYFRDVMSEPGGRKYVKYYSKKFYL